MDHRKQNDDDLVNSSSAGFNPYNLPPPQLSYSTDSLGKHHSGSRELSTDIIQSCSSRFDAASNCSSSQISMIETNRSYSKSDDHQSDYVEFDLGHQDSKTGVFSSDRVNIIRNDNSKAKLVKKGRAQNEKKTENPSTELDKAAQLYMDEVSTSVFKPAEYKVASTQLEIASSSKSLESHANSKGLEEEDDDWAPMETAADDEIYDDKGSHVCLSEDHILNQANQSTGVGVGYTRIAAETQAELYKEADKKTDFLFKASKDSRDSAGNPFYDEFDNEDDFEDSDFQANFLSPLSQLQTTKKLLKDSQKFAYIGLIKLVMNDMATQLAKQALVSRSYLSGRKFVKRMNLSQSSFGQWQYKISDRIYSHLDLSSDEIHMIEVLGSHGITTGDLAKSLQTHEAVENPAFDIEAQIDKQETKDTQNAVLRPEDIANDKTIEIDVAWTVLCDLFLVLLADSVYDSRSRTLLLKFGCLLGLDVLEIFQFERRITDSLQMEDASEQVWDEKEILKSRKKKAKKKKMMYVGIATIGGSLVLGLSAGLLAPVIGAGIAAGLTTVGISGTTGFLAGAGGTALVTATGTAIGARIGSKGMLKRVGDVKTFEFIPLHNNKRVNLIITVSGWMNSKADDIRLPFSTVDPVMGDLYSLLWEPEILQSTGQTMGILATEALSTSVQQILGATILMALMSAVQIPMALSKLGYLLDNPWNVSLDRAWKAGLVLADTLISRNLGVRPVTLVGFSLGSRVIYSCLLELAKRGAYGLVEKVVLFGSPIVVSTEDLALARSVVSGDYINGFSKKDWILGYLFRATSGGLRRVAGLAPIEKMEGIQNFDCTQYVQGHMEYRKAIPQLLAQLDFQVLAEEFVEIDDPDPEQTERQRQLISEFDEARKQMESEQANGKKKGFWKKWFGPKKKEWWNIYSEDTNSKSSDQIDVNQSLPNQDFQFDVDEVMNEVEKLKLKEDSIGSDQLRTSYTGEQKVRKESEDESIPPAEDQINSIDDHSSPKKENANDEDYNDITTKENITMSFA